MAHFPHFSLLDYLEKHAPVVCDGAKSLPLQALGFPKTNACFMANLTHPDQVCQVHRAYLEAGASILRTNTEGAHRLALEALGLGERGENINNNGMALLREGIGMRGIPVGSVASVQKNVKGKVLKGFLEQAYGEQFIYQADTGAKFFMLTDFEDLADLKIALRVAKTSIQKQGVAHLKLTPKNAYPHLLSDMESLQKTADFIGIQASWQQPDLAEQVADLVEHFGIVSVLLEEPKPLPSGEVSQGFLQMAQALLAQQPAIIGGGTHTTPHHIQTLAEQVRQHYEAG